MSGKRRRAKPVVDCPPNGEVGRHLLACRLPGWWELRVPWQLIGEVNPRQALGFPVMKLGRDLAWVVKAPDRDVDEPWDVLGDKTDLSSAARTEAATCAGR